MDEHNMRKKIVDTVGFESIRSRKISSCSLNPDALPLDHELHFSSPWKISVQMKSQMVVEKLYQFF